MSKIERYDAFISYRHCQPDMEIAEKLQKKLEGFRLPSDVAKKVGRTRLSRVFRDDSELSVSDDLSEVIDQALKNSDFLIAVCSPQYRASTWCQRELQIFRSIRDRKHILIVLADGEPDTAFPELLYFDDVYTSAENGQLSYFGVPKEPLAADCRGETEKERDAKIEKSAVRLIASILGLEYDDLVQRQKKEEQRRRKRRTLLAFSILGTILAISFFFLILLSKQNLEISRKNREISDQKDEISEQARIISEKYADSLAATSDNLLRDGKREAAVYAARLGLSSDENNESAMQAMTKALGIYEGQDDFSCDNEITLPCSISDFQVSPSGGYAALEGLDFKIHVIDLSSGKQLFIFDPAPSQTCVFDGENGFLFQRNGENFKYYSFSDASEKDLGFSEVKRVLSASGGNGFGIDTGTDILLYRDGEICFKMNIASELPVVGERRDTTLSFASDGQAALLLISDYDVKQSFLYSVDMTRGIATRITSSNEDLIYHVSSDGESLIWSEGLSFSSKLKLMDLSTMRIIEESDQYEDIYDVFVSGSDIVIYDSKAAYILGSDLLVCETIPLQTLIKSSHVFDNTILLIDRAGGLYKIKDGEYQYINASTKGTGLCADCAGGTYYIAENGDNHLYTYSNRYSSYMTTYTGPTPPGTRLDPSEDEEVEKFFEKIAESEKEYGAEQVYWKYFCENGNLFLVQLWDGTVVIYDRASYEKLRTVYNIDGFVSSFYYDDRSDLYYISSKNVYVFDGNLKNLYQIPNCRLAGFDQETGYAICADSRSTRDYCVYYLVRPVSKDELLAMADEYLGDYSPDPKIKEKYGLD